MNYDTLSKKYESLCNPPGDGMKKCEKCDTEFASDLELGMHMKNHNAKTKNINVISVRKVTKVKN